MIKKFFKLIIFSGLLTLANASYLVSVQSYPGSTGYFLLSPASAGYSSWGNPADLTIGKSNTIQITNEDLSASDFPIGFVATNSGYNSVYVDSGIFYFTPSTSTLHVTNFSGNGSDLTNLTGANVTGTVSSATNLASGAEGSLPYQTASGATSFVAAPAERRLLSYDPDNHLPEWLLNQNIFGIGSALNLSAGATGSLPYQSASSTTTFLSLGTSGYFLTAGASAPQWTNPSSLTVGTATNATDSTNAANIAVTDDTTTNSTHYLLYSAAASGNTGAKVASTKFTVNPSTGTLSATTLSGSLAASNISGILTYDQGGTGLNAYTQGDLIYASAANTLAKLGIGSNTYLLQSNGSTPSWVDPTTVTIGSASTIAITNDTTTNATFYPTFVGSSSGNNTLKTSSTLWTWNPSTATQTINGNFTLTPTSTAGNQFMMSTGISGELGIFINNSTNDANSYAKLKIGSSGGGEIRILSVGGNHSGTLYALTAGQAGIVNSFSSLYFGTGSAGTSAGTSVAMQLDTSQRTILYKGLADTSYSRQVPTTGFSITLDNTTSLLALVPATTLATGTITLPASPIDGWKVTISTTKTITALTLSPNSGQTLDYTPTTLAVGQAITVRYNSSTTSWMLD